MPPALRFEYRREHHFQDVLQRFCSNGPAPPSTLVDNVRDHLRQNNIDPRHATMAQIREAVRHVNNGPRYLNQCDALHAQFTKECGVDIRQPVRLVPVVHSDAEPTNTALTAPSSATALPLDHVFDDDCGICLEPITHETHSVLACRHIFHRACIREWLVDNNTCPFCRSHATLERLLRTASDGSLDDFVRQHEGEALQTLLVTFFGHVSRAFLQIAPNRNFPSFAFMIKKMAQLFVDHTTLCEANKDTLRQVARRVSTSRNVHRREQQEQMWRQIMLRL